MIGITLFGACKSSNTTPASQVSLKLNQSARVGADLIVAIDSLTDSRCPTNAQCIWAGEAVVALSLSKANETQMRRLSLPTSARNRTDSTTVQFGNQSYTVLLQAVTPYPVLGDTTPKQAVIQVNAR